MTTSGDPRYDDLSALFFNCTLKPSPQLSHTQGLMDLSAAIMRKHGVRVETIRAVDHGRLFKSPQFDSGSRTMRNRH